MTYNDLGLSSWYINIPVRHDITPSDHPGKCNEWHLQYLPNLQPSEVLPRCDAVQAAIHVVHQQAAVAQWGSSVREGQQDVWLKHSGRAEVDAPTCVCGRHRIVNIYISLFYVQRSIHCFR